MSSLATTAEQFITDLNDGVGWEGVKKYCHPNATFVSAALPTCKTVERFALYKQDLVTYPCPNYNYEVDNITVDDSTGVVTILESYECTHDGRGGPPGFPADPEYPGFAQNQISYTLEFSDGLIKHAIIIFDIASMYAELGWEWAIDNEPMNIGLQNNKGEIDSDGNLRIQLNAGGYRTYKKGQEPGSAGFGKSPEQLAQMTATSSEPAPVVVAAATVLATNKPITVQETITVRAEPQSSSPAASPSQSTTKVVFTEPVYQPADLGDLTMDYRYFGSGFPEAITAAKKGRRDLEGLLRNDFVYSVPVDQCKDGPVRSMDKAEFCDFQMALVEAFPDLECSSLSSSSLADTVTYVEFDPHGTHNGTLGNFRDGAKLPIVTATAIVVDLPREGVRVKRENDSENARVISAVGGIRVGSGLCGIAGYYDQVGSPLFFYHDDRAYQQMTEEYKNYVKVLRAQLQHERNYARALKMSHEKALALKQEQMESRVVEVQQHYAQDAMIWLNQLLTNDADQKVFEIMMRQLIEMHALLGAEKISGLLKSAQDASLTKCWLRWRTGSLKESRESVRDARDEAVQLAMGSKASYGEVAEELNNLRSSSASEMQALREENKKLQNRMMVMRGDVATSEEASVTEVPVRFELPPNDKRFLGKSFDTATVNPMDTTPSKLRTLVRNHFDDLADDEFILVWRGIPLVDDSKSLARYGYYDDSARGIVNSKPTSVKVCLRSAADDEIVAVARFEGTPAGGAVGQWPEWTIRFQQALASRNTLNLSKVLSTTFEFKGGLPQSLNREQFLAFMSALWTSSPDWSSSLSNALRTGCDDSHTFVKADFTLGGTITNDLTYDGFPAAASTGSRVDLPTDGATLQFDTESGKCSGWEAGIRRVGVDGTLSFTGLYEVLGVSL